MSILLVYATRHGATAGIAERIAALLTESDQPAEARPVEEVTSVNGYDAVVLGAAAYMFHWLKPAVKFARKHRAELVSRRVWAVQQRPARDGPDRQGRQERPAGAPAQGVRRAHRTRAPPRRAGLGSAHTTRAPNRSEGGNASSGTCRLLKDIMPTGDFRDSAAIESGRVRSPRPPSPTTASRSRCGRVCRSPATGGGLLCAFSSVSGMEVRCDGRRRTVCSRRSPTASGLRRPGLNAITAVTAPAADSWADWRRCDAPPEGVEGLFRRPEGDASTSGREHE